jgi:predicted GNAT superfamily acetyltransferase
VTEPYTIRDFSSIEEYCACVDLQEATWGVGFSERVSPAILKVAQILGGVAAGAYDAHGELVGFVFGMTGVRRGELAHWSDMLAVRPGLRDTGLGRRLKAYQRDRVRKVGVDRMYWTFDPLQSRNAHLNLTRLGAVVREYEENMYGDTDSPLHRGIGTDRFIALWELSSERVEGRLDGRSSFAPVEAGRVPFAVEAVETDGRLRPVRNELSRNESVAVAIPSDITALMRDDLELAIEWRHATRAAFTYYLSRGYEVREFERGERASTYVLVASTECE